MSLSMNEKEISWREHQETLRRIRSQLGNVRTPQRKKTPRRSPLAAASRHDHNPYGKYRKTTPSYLPSLEANEEEKNEVAKNLRGSKYGVVPPVKVQPHRNNKVADYDSWGEESGSDLESGDELDYQPQQYPYPYPVYAYPHPPPPPPVVYGPPFQPFYPPPPPVTLRKKRQERESKGMGRLTNEERIEVYKSRKHRKSERPWEQGGYTYLPPHGAKRRNVFDAEQNELLQRYKYIYPRETPYSSQDYYISRRYKDDQDEDISTVQVANDMLSSVVPRMIRDIVRESLGEMANDYLGHDNTSSDPLEEWLTHLVNDAVWDASFDVVRDTVKEMADEHIEWMSTVDVFEDMVDNHIDDVGKELVEESLMELVAEDMIEKEIIYPVIDEEAPDVATEVLDHYDSQIERRELKEVSRQAGDKLTDSVCLDYLVSLISRQGQVWTESDHANKHMDHLMVNLLLEQFHGVKRKRDRTVMNKSIQKLHEKVVTDVALDLLLQQLTAFLDEDLADVDEYERDIEIKPSYMQTPLPFFIS